MCKHRPPGGKQSPSSLPMAMEGDKEMRHLFVLACLAQKTKRYSMARAAWEKYLSVRPSDPKARHNLGVCLDNLGDKASALLNFERAFELHPGMAESGANAAGLLIQAGEAERACKLCYLALKGDPECAVALFNLNTALRMVGRPSEAISLSWQWIADRLPPGTQGHGSGVSRIDATTRISKEDARSWVVDKPQRPPPPPPPPRRRCHALAPSPALCRSTGLPGCHKPGGEEGFESRTGKHGSGAEVCCIRDDAARGVPAVGTAAPGEVTVVCIRWGRKYGPEYVQRLAAGVRRHLRSDHRFVCFTDDADALGEVAGVVVKPLGMAGYGEWRGWWHKAFLFSREAGLTGRVLYIDLDTVIVGSLEDVAGYAGPFATLSAEGMANERRQTGLNSSVMSWDAGVKGDAGAVHAVYGLLREAYSLVTACVHKLDHWLEMTVPGAAILQEVYPGQIVEYASLGADAGEDGRKLPPEARVLCFPLEPKPHQVEQAWIKQMWMGHEDEMR